MKRQALVGVVVLLAAAALAAQAPPAIEKELLRLENDWNIAIEKKDLSFLERLYAAEYFSTTPEGATITKAQDLADVKASSTAAPFALSDMKVRVYGDTAVVTGVNTVNWTAGGKQWVGPIRFTDVFVKRDGRWQVVASHGSRVAKK
jgi:ketosteroid isomerase-like protein